MTYIFISHVDGTNPSTWGIVQHSLREVGEEGGGGGERGGREGGAEEGGAEEGGGGGAEEERGGRKGKMKGKREETNGKQ